MCQSVLYWGFPGGSGVIYLPSGKRRFDPWVGKIFWRRQWLPTPVFLTGKFHGQKNLVGYSPCGCKELDTTERPTRRELRFHMLGGN